MAVFNSNIPLFLVFILFTFSCNHETLQFFFDGVNERVTPESSLNDSITVNQKPELLKIKNSNVPEPDLVIHPDYKNKMCNKCHDVNHSNRLKFRQPDLCYQCHKPFQNSFRILHGPVAAGLCNACHLPHQSEYAYLLKMSIRQTCQFCHTTGDVKKNPAHNKISSIECLHCHNSHGGNTVNLLKN